MMEDASFVSDSTEVGLSGFNGTIDVQDGKIIASSSCPMKLNDRIVIYARFGKGLFEPDITKTENFRKLNQSNKVEYKKEKVSLLKKFISDPMPFISVILVFLSPIAVLVSKYRMRKQREKVSKNISATPLLRLPPYRRELPVKGSLLRTYAVINSGDDLAPEFGEISSGMTLNERLLCQAFVIRLINKGAIKTETDADGNRLFRIIEPKEKIIINSDGLIERIDFYDDKAVELLIWTILSRASGEDHLLQKGELKMLIREIKDELVPMATALHNLIYREIPPTAISLTDLQEVYGFIRYLKDYDKVEGKEKQDAEHWKELLAFASLLGYDKQFIKATEQGYPNPEQMPDYISSYKEMDTRASWLGSDFTDILEVSYSVVEITQIEIEERRERERWTSGGDRDYSGGGGSGFR